MGRLTHRLVFQFADLRDNFFALLLLLRRWDFDERLIVVVQEGEELVILALQNGIVFVVVALTAVDREAEPRFADGVHAVNHRFGAELLGLDAAFLVKHRVAHEAGGDALVERRVRQQIAGELFESELVERQVAIERLDDVVTIGPDRTRGVLFVTVAVGVTCRVEPVPAPALAVMRRRKQAFDEFVVGFR